MKQDKVGYNQNLWGGFAILLGAGLLVEHIWMWGEIWVLDFVGHEWLGFLLILLGIGLNLKWGKLSTELVGIFKKKDDAI